MALSKPARRTLKAIGGAAAVSLITLFLGRIIGLDLAFFAGWWGALTFKSMSRARLDDLIPPKPRQ
jgi:hypothetical protein